MHVPGCVRCRNVHIILARVTIYIACELFQLAKERLSIVVIQSYPDDQGVTRVWTQPPVGKFIPSDSLVVMISINFVLIT